MKKNNNKYLKLIKQIESIRSKNNSNWMDILRLAFEYAPEKSAQIMSQINNKDKKIFNLLSKLNVKKKRKKNK